jgi:hypothetical protein
MGENEMHLPGRRWRELVARDVSAPQQLQQSGRVQLKDLAGLRWSGGGLSAFSVRKRQITDDVEIASWGVRSPPANLLGLGERGHAYLTLGSVEAAQAAAILQARAVIPVHAEGWAHFM